jgi:hypothetical protein
MELLPFIPKQLTTVEPISIQTMVEVGREVFVRLLVSLISLFFPDIQVNNTVMKIVGKTQTYFLIQERVE